jgi:hypothetical protein
VGFVDPFWYPSPWGGYGYAYPYGYVDPPSDPIVAPTPPATPSYWFYCPDSNAYYPYVNQCASGWRMIAPPG